MYRRVQQSAVLASSDLIMVTLYGDSGLVLAKGGLSGQISLD